MTRYFLFLICCSMSLSLKGQSSPALPKWEGMAAFGSHSASLGIPDLDPISPWFSAGYTPIFFRSGNSFELVQQVQLGYFWHQSHQHGIQLFTELAPTFRFPANLRLTPLMLGGGYQLSILDMPSFVFESSTNTYQQQTTATHQWILSVGSQLGYEFGATETHRGHRIWLSYRLHLQGIVIRESIPTLPYTTFMLTLDVSTPFSSFTLKQINLCFHISHAL